VIGGPAIHAADFGFAIVPVCLNATILTFAGWWFRCFSGHSYPHRPSFTRSPLAPASINRVHPQDLERALAEIGDTLDVTLDDLTFLLERAEGHAADRRR
jgi:CBS domain-containing membrane protein